MRKALLLVLVAALVAACGTAPRKAETPRKPSYYADDGPPDTIPGNLADIPDAVPRDEPFHRFANRPYTVFGRTYVPVVNRDATRERGVASWYGKKFQGQKTASGEPYDMFAMTAAHPTLPIPSYARVTNLKNGKSVVVRINDRGPFHSDRIIDLSYAAAAKIGIAGPGSGTVEVERIFEATPTTLAATPTPPIQIPMPAPAATQSVSAPAVETPMVVEEPAGIWLQLGAFSSRESAESFRDHAARELSWLNEPIQIFARDGMNRVRLGPYRNRIEAGAIGDKVRETLGLTPTVIAR